MRRFSGLVLGAGGSSNRKNCSNNGKVRSGSDVQQQQDLQNTASETTERGGAAAGPSSAGFLAPVGPPLNGSLPSTRCNAQRAKARSAGNHCPEKAREDAALCPEPAHDQEETGALKDACQGPTQDIFGRADRPFRLDQEMAPRTREDEKYVYPWVVVVVNVDLAKWQLNGDSWALMHAKLDKFFAAFNLTNVKVFDEVQAQQLPGMVALMFDRDLNGFCDAHALEIRFLQSGRGRKDWDRKRPPRGNPGKDLYGWIARREDYYADSPVGKFLFEYGELKTVAMVGEDRMHKYSQRLQHTADLTVNNCMRQVQRLESDLRVKNKELQAADKKVEGLQNAIAAEEKVKKRFEDEQLKMAAVHKSEIDTLNIELKKAQDECSLLKVENANLSADSEKRCIEMEQVREAGLEAERKKHESELREMQRRMHGLSESHKKAYANLVRKHERDLKVVQELQKKKQWEANQQKAELDKLRLLVRKQKSGERGLRSETNGKLSRGKELFTPSDKYPLKLLTNVKREFTASQSVQGKTSDLTDSYEKESLHTMLNSLRRKERETSEELEQSRRVAVEVLEKHGSREKIGVKRMGELDSGPWKVACKRKFKDDWEAQFTRIFAEWEQSVRDSEWHPFKVVPVGDEDEWKEVINHDDKRLMVLRQELGKAVCKTVTNAKCEVEEFNATGRYPVPVAYNFREFRRANLNEVLKYLDELIENGKIAKRRRRSDCASGSASVWT